MCIIEVNKNLNIPFYLSKTQHVSANLSYVIESGAILILDVRKIMDCLLYSNIVLHFERTSYNELSGDFLLQVCTHVEYTGCSKWNESRTSKAITWVSFSPFLPWFSSKFSFWLDLWFHVLCYNIIRPLICILSISQINQFCF